MEMEVGLDPFGVYKKYVSFFGCVLPAIFFKVDQRSLFRAIFDEKG